MNSEWTSKGLCSCKLPGFEGAKRVRVERGDLPFMVLIEKGQKGQAMYDSLGWKGGSNQKRTGRRNYEALYYTLAMVDHH